MARSLVATPSFSTPYPDAAIPSFRMTIAVVAVDMPAAVFVYQVLPAQPAQIGRRALFTHVACAAELEEIPEGAPQSDAAPPLFRLATVDVVERTRDRLLEDRDHIVDDLRALVDALNENDVLTPDTPITIP